MSILEEKLVASARDISLIIEEVQASAQYPVASVERIRELESALRGMLTVVRDMSELATQAEATLKSWRAIHRGNQITPPTP